MKTTLALLILLAAACGGGSAEARPTACAVTRLACQACAAAEATYCPNAGGEDVAVED